MEERQPIADGPTRQPGLPREWSVLLKLEVVPPARHLTEEEPRELVKRLHPQTTVDGGGGRDITVRTWQAASDAGEAGQRTVQQVRAAAAALGLPPLKIIRQHATSPRLRDISVIRGTQIRLTRNNVWGILANVRLGANSRDATAEDRDAIRGHLAGTDTRVVGAGRELFVQFWVEAPDIGAAAAMASEHLEASLNARGLSDYELYRLQPCSPAEHFFEVYPGAFERLSGNSGNE
jgi:hypothetical protein